MVGEDDYQLRVCLTCNKEFMHDMDACPDDGGPLVLAQRDPLIGSIFADKYEILSVLGEGGMSKVYKARHKFMDRVVAVKLLHEHLVSDSLALQRFEHESKAASSLSHQNIVTVHDFGRTKSGQAYFVMDCLEGESLADVLARDVRLPLAESISIFKQTCEGLEHAHKKGVVHRDLKPSNLVLMKNDDGTTQVKIVDFGIAKLMPKDGKPRQNITQTGEIFGSPLYMSPEQCNSKNMDHRSDIYSLGCLMYETLAGVPPLMGENFVNTVVKHINEAPPPFSQTAPEANVPPQVEACIMKCLEKEPYNRYQSASEVRQSLLDAGLEAGVKGLRAGAVTIPSKNPVMNKTFERVKLTGEQHAVPIEKGNNKNLIIFLAGSLVVVLGGIVTFALWPGPEGDKGPNYLRFLWQIEQNYAQQAYDRQNYDEAKRVLIDAKSIAIKFQDKHKRLVDTLTLLAKAYGKCGMYAEEENTNQEIVATNNQLVRDEVYACEQMLQSLQRSSDSTTSATMNQLEAEANADTIMLCARKLLARSMFAEAEQLLYHAIVTFDHLKLASHQKTADFKLLLAETLTLQQRLPEVRALLVQVNNIRKQAPDLSNPESARKLVKSYLRLGQFDRDQSDFKEAREELKTALDIAQSKLSQDSEILAEAYNSYGDLLRQTGDKVKAAEYIKKADQLGKGLNQHARALSK